MFDQCNFDIRCEWGEEGASRFALVSDVVIIVDVMSFSSCVSVAVSRGATVYPFRARDETGVAFANFLGADLAGARGVGRYSLSPTSLMQIPQGTRLVLPSPNGATLSLATGKTTTLAGCLRNASAVARAAMSMGKKIAVIPAGERWKENHKLRPSYEDLLGAGAILQHLSGSHSPEALLAADAWRGAQGNLMWRLENCASGKELISMGYRMDIAVCAEVDADDCVPVLRDGAFIRVN